MTPRFRFAKPSPQASGGGSKREWFCGARSAHETVTTEGRWAFARRANAGRPPSFHRDNSETPAGKTRAQGRAPGLWDGNACEPDPSSLP